MTASQIQQVRRFNRVVSRCIGALEDGYLRRDRPLAEAQVIFEIGRNGADVRALRTRLGLDSGCLSRLLRSLVVQGLVTLGRQAGDGRVRRVTLTAAGETEFTTYSALSDGLAESILAPFSPTQRVRLVIAKAEFSSG